MHKLVWPGLAWLLMWHKWTAGTRWGEARNALLMLMKLSPRAAAAAAAAETRLLYFPLPFRLSFVDSFLKRNSRPFDQSRPFIISKMNLQAPSAAATTTQQEYNKNGEKEEFID